MVNVVKYEPKHMQELVQLEIPELIKTLMGPRSMELITLQKHAFTVLANDTGKVLLCGGVKELWPDRGEAWAIFNPDCKKYFLAIHNAVRRFLDVVPYRRVEATVDVAFDEGHRWVKALGFECEAEFLPMFFPDGADGSLYSRVRY